MSRHKESLSDLNKSFGIKSYSLDMTYLSQKWISGNSEIDQFIKNAQMNSIYYHKEIEFIYYDKLEDVGKDGLEQFILQLGLMFKIHYEYQLNRYSADKYGIELYGITYNSANNEYLMVFEYADKGDLRQYSTDFKTLD
ncbi:17913_t:CDS:2 [Cetraspora pellucida]|uniref:17913_t:CDS:1 n=1 Tax=Cetraspora pellucida TaxID=1433469 RepID=A0A9N9IQJ9_9GLOM|nr:17913_t:CDS:2 [Cetraspora pellucida]